MRVGCGSATIGMFAKQWLGHVDEVVVVDDHITGVLSEHQAGKVLDIPATGIKMKGRRSTPGRYFQVAEPGVGWGGTNISDPLSILGPFNPKEAWPGLTMLMVSTTGEHQGFYRLDEALRPVEAELPEALRLSVERIQENCEPALCTVLFMGGAGRIVARGRDRKSRTAHPLGEGCADTGDLRRRAGLYLARGRYYLHGGRDPPSRQFLRLCADACACGADRVHDATLRLCRAWRPYGSCASTELRSTRTRRGMCRRSTAILGRSEPPVRRRS